MNLREDVLNAVPPPAREGVLKMALDHNIVDPNDPTWGMVALAWSATTAAAAGRETLDTALATAARIPETIYTSTIKAGADLSATVAQGIENKTAEASAALVQAIGVAASRGAGELQKAAAGLDRLGAEKGAAFVETWKTDLARAVAAQAKSSLAWRLGRGYGVVAGALLMMMLVGAGIAVGAGVFAHKIIASPHAEWRGHEVVFTSPHVYHVQCPWGVCFSARPTGH